MLQQSLLTEQLLEMLKQYESISKYYPKNQHQSHRLAKLSEWNQAILGNKSRETTMEVLNQFSLTFGELAVKNPPQLVAGYSYKLQLMLKESNDKISQLIEHKLQKKSKLNFDYGSIQRDFKKFVIAKRATPSRHQNMVTMAQIQLLSEKLFELETNAQHERDPIWEDEWGFENLVGLSILLAETSDILFDLTTEKNANDEMMVNGVKCAKMSSKIYEASTAANSKFQVCLIFIKKIFFVF